MNDIDSTDVVGKTPSMIAAGYGKVQAKEPSLIKKEPDKFSFTHTQWIHSMQGFSLPREPGKALGIT